MVYVKNVNSLRLVIPSACQCYFFNEILNKWTSENHEVDEIYSKNTIKG